MGIAIRPLNAAVSATSKIVVLALIVFAGGLVSGYLVTQLQNGNSTGYSKEETLELSNPHVWVKDDWTEAAMAVLNTGGQDAIIRKITVRGIECNWSSVYYWRTDTGPISNELEQTSEELSGATFTIVIDGVQRTFHQATGPLALGKGWTIVFYVGNLLDLTFDDGGSKVIISVFTEEALYYKEVVVDATFTFMQTEQMSITSMTFPSVNNITLAVRNTGSVAVTIAAVTVNGVATTFTTTKANNEWEVGATGYIYITTAWTSGNTYRVVLQSSTGTNVASYEKRAS